MNLNPKHISGLYAVTPDSNDGDALVAKVEAALLGGARIVQYRNKQAHISIHLETASALAKLCHQHGAIFIINDDADLALNVGADGVHLGKDDGDIASTRKLLGKDAIIGVSCYNSLERALAAEQQGANYVAFGAMFPSSTKPNAPRATLELLRAAKTQLNIPIVAIGGISLHNAADVVNAGADALAVINALFDAPDIQNTAQQFSDFY
ncbi:MAG: thiamine phosphate synthase [Methylophilaceae bacterium]